MLPPHPDAGRQTRPSPRPPNLTPYPSSLSSPGKSPKGGMVVGRTFCQPTRTLALPSCVCVARARVWIRDL
eukprot:6187171-Pleurochrysis_carterae.AAC.1